MKTKICLLAILSVLALAANAQPASETNRSVFDRALQLSSAERKAIVKEASQAVQQFMRSDVRQRKRDEIPPQFWGECITKLKPLRVRNDRVNIAIVCKETQDQEEGLYVTIPISSYAPVLGKRFLTLEKLSQQEDGIFGELYRYRISKSEAK